MRLATWFSLQRVNFIPLVPPISHSNHNVFYRSTSSNLDITLSANFSGPAVTLTQTVEDRSLLWNNVYWASSSPHQSSALRFPPSPSTQAPPTKLLCPSPFAPFDAFLDGTDDGA